MTNHHLTTKAELLAAVEPAWSRLNAALDQLTEAQMTTIQDSQGWTVKDHLVHLTAWEQSVVFLLAGRPRHAGLGIAESLYAKGDEDAINAVIQQQRHDLPLADVLRQFRTTHAQLMEHVARLSDADLQKPYRHYLPDEPGEGDGPPAIRVIYSNTANHFAEHLAWIEVLVGKSS